MKRHESLAPLSREHHAALILAQLLKKDAPAYKGLPNEPGGKAAYALHIYTTTLRDHFIKEEAILDKVKKYHADIEKLSEEITMEHRQLTTDFLSLATAVSLVDALDGLGLALEKHIRKEERILFPLIQEYCPDEILKSFVL